MTLLRDYAKIYLGEPPSTRQSNAIPRTIMTRMATGLSTLLSGIVSRYRARVIASPLIITKPIRTKWKPDARCLIRAALALRTDT